MLSVLIFFPIVAAIGIWLGCRNQANVARSLTLTTVVIECFMVAWLFCSNQVAGFSLTEHIHWIPNLGIQYLLSIDGISLSLIGLSCLLFLVSIISAWQQIDRWQAFGPLLLATLGGIIGALLALDLLLFYVFWELMLIPVYFMLSFWGSQGTKKAAMRFMLVTIAGSLLMLVAITLMSVIHFEQNGQLTFNYFELANTPLTAPYAMPLALCFLIAFLIKVPGFPFHFWAPDTYREGDPAVIMLLSGVMANVGAYGILRFCLVLFPQSMHQLSHVGMALGAIGAIYAALLAFRQTDLRSVIAYSSISHMNLVVLAIFAWQLQSLNGAVLQLVAHGLSVAGLFAVIGMLQSRGFNGDINKMGGLYKKLPGVGIFFLFLIAASVGVPGLANFAGEILLLAGSFRVSPLLTSFAAFSILLGVVYFLKAYGRSMLGPISEHNNSLKLKDVSMREKSLIALIVIGLFWVGLAPNDLLHLMASPTTELSDIHPTLAVTQTLVEGVINVTP